MDREPEELQFLGLVGIYCEAYKILLSWRRLFAQIALILVLPLSVLFLAHIYVSHLLFSKIGHNEEALDVAPPGSPSESAIVSRISTEWTTFILFKAAYLLALLVLSLLSTFAVVYSVASIYTAKDLSFAKVLTVIPKVWRRLMITFLWAFLLLVAYNTVTNDCPEPSSPSPSHRSPSPPATTVFTIVGHHAFNRHSKLLLQPPSLAKLSAASTVPLFQVHDLRQCCLMPSRHCASSLPPPVAP